MGADVYCSHGGLLEGLVPLLTLRAHSTSLLSTAMTERMTALLLHNISIIIISQSRQKINTHFMQNNRPSQRQTLQVLMVSIAKI